MRVYWVPEYWLEYYSVSSELHCAELAKSRLVQNRGGQTSDGAELDCAKTGQIAPENWCGLVHNIPAWRSSRGGCSEPTF